MANPDSWDYFETSMTAIEGVVTSVAIVAATFGKPAELIWQSDLAIDGDDDHGSLIEVFINGVEQDVHFQLPEGSTALEGHGSLLATAGASVSKNGTFEPGDLIELKSDGAQVTVGTDLMCQLATEPI